MTDLQATGVVENVPVLDLSHTTWEEDLAGIDRIANVGAVVVPENLAHALARISMQNVGAVVPVPTGAHVRVHTGTMTLGGDALADPGGDNEVLVVIGGLLITSPLTRIGYREVIVIGTVLAPRGSESVLGAGLTRMTGMVHYYRYAEGQQLRPLTGQQTLSGSTLANQGGSPDDVLVVTGQTIVTGQVTAVGFQQIYYTGEVIVPRDSESVLAPLLAGAGQLVWYDGSPRCFLGDETFGRGFFELVDEPLGLLLVGSFRIDDDVPAGLLRDKVTSISLVGSLAAPKELIPVVQLLATAKYGDISVAGDDTEH
ncbi:hypothetical protein ABN034_04860 [Actinopolymorpha sp. B11F2]|uniref:hypothetical protein n=1 Tax=Actinopolymorpha sp. B11F2 TaxID=3160862 RepID=UPI0032E3F867